MKSLVKGDPFHRRYKKAVGEQSFMLKVLSLTLVVFCAADFVFLRTNISVAGDLDIFMATVIAVAVTAVSVVLSHIGGDQAGRFVKGQRQAYRLAIAIATPVLECLALGAITYFRLSAESFTGAQGQALAAKAQEAGATGQSTIGGASDAVSSMDPVAFTTLLTVLLIMTFVVGFVISFLRADPLAEDKVARVGARVPYEDLAIQRPALESVVEGGLRSGLTEELTAQEILGRKKIDCLLVLSLLHAVKDPADAKSVEEFLREFFASQHDRMVR